MYEFRRDYEGELLQKRFHEMAEQIRSKEISEAKRNGDLIFRLVETNVEQVSAEEMGDVTVSFCLDVLMFREYLIKTLQQMLDEKPCEELSLRLKQQMEQYAHEMGLMCDLKVTSRNVPKEDLLKLLKEQVDKRLQVMQEFADICDEMAEFLVW